MLHQLPFEDLILEAPILAMNIFMDDSPHGIDVYGRIAPIIKQCGILTRHEGEHSRVSYVDVRIEQCVLPKLQT